MGRMHTHYAANRPSSNVNFAHDLAYIKYMSQSIQVMMANEGSRPGIYLQPTRQEAITPRETTPVISHISPCFYPEECAPSGFLPFLSVRL